MLACTFRPCQVPVSQLVEAPPPSCTTVPWMTGTSGAHAFVNRAFFKVAMAFPRTKQRMRNGTSTTIPSTMSELCWIHSAMARGYHPAMDIQAYLDRIGYHGPLAPTAETLRALQIAHLQTVPFENLSIHARQPIVLDDESLFDKVVMRRRGGFCYELNGLFAALLRALRFQVSMLSAAVARGDGTFGPDFDRSEEHTSEL